MSSVLRITNKHNLYKNNENVNPEIIKKSIEKFGIDTKFVVVKFT